MRYNRVYLFDLDVHTLSKAGRLYDFFFNMQFKENQSGKTVPVILLVILTIFFEPINRPEHGNSRIIYYSTILLLFYYSTICMA